MSSRKRTIIFDWGGVCCTPAEPFASKRLQAEVKKSPDEIAALVKPALGRYYAGHCTREEFWGSVLGTLGVRGVSIDELSEAYAQSYTLRPEVLSLARQLRSHARVVLLSNLTPEMSGLIKKAHGIEQVFDECFFSCDLGLLKPAREIYERVTAKLGVSPFECVFVDDTAENVEAARSFGWGGIQFTDYPSLLMSLAPLGLRLSFLPNNHSRSEVQYGTPSPETARSVREILRTEYGVESADAVSIADEGSRHSRNYRVEAGGRELLYRIYGASHSKTSILLTHSLLQESSKLGALVPTLVPAAHGETLLDRKGFHAVFKFVRGDHFSGGMEELRVAGREIGILHRALAQVSRSLIEKYEQAPLPEYARTAVASERLDALESTAGRGSAPFDRAVAELLPRLKVETQKSLAARGDIRSLPKQIIHSDLHPHNLLLANRSMRCILDLDAARWESRMRDVAFALHRLVRQHIVATEPSNVREAVGKASESFLAAYEKENPLLAAERRALEAFMRDEIVQKIHFVLEQHYGIGEGRFDDELPKLAMLLEEAGMFVGEAA